MHDRQVWCLFPSHGRSLLVFALSAAAFVASALAHAAIPGFELVPREFSIVKMEVVATNLPRTRDMGAFGICGPAAATAVMEHERCNQLKQSCPDLPERMRPSILDVARVAQLLPRGEDQADLESYPRKLTEGAPGLVALVNGYFRIKEISSEACAPIAPLASASYPETAITRAAHEKASLDVITGLRRIHASYQRAAAACIGSKNASESCPDDAKRMAAETAIKSLLSSSVPNGVLKGRVAEALSAKDPDDFLGRLFIAPECAESKNLLTFHSQFQALRSWPETKVQRTVEATLAKARVILRSNHLIFVNFICLSADFSPNKGSKYACRLNGQSAGHTTVITGVREVCTSSGQCMGAVRVLNAWGDYLQKESGGGWVRADSFFAQTGLPLNNLFWVDDARIEGVRK